MKIRSTNRFLRLAYDIGSYVLGVILLLLLLAGLGLFIIVSAVAYFVGWAWLLKVPSGNYLTAILTGWMVGLLVGSYVVAYVGTKLLGVDEGEKDNNSGR